MLFEIDRTNEMQIQYYQNHFKEYLGDALKHLQDRERSNLETRKTGDDSYLRLLNLTEPTDTTTTTMTTTNKGEEPPPPPELLTQLVSASTTSSSLFVSFKEFYIRELDFIDLYREYVRWLKIGESPIGYLLFYFYHLTHVNNHSNSI